MFGRLAMGFANVRAGTRALTLVLVQARAAEKHGVSKMLCGSISSFWMHALTIKAATHTRAGNDYLPGVAGPGCCELGLTNSGGGRQSTFVSCDTRPSQNGHVWQKHDAVAS